MHHVSAADPQLVMACVMKVKNTRMLKETPEIRAHRDVFRKSRHPCPQGTDTADDDFYLDPGL